MSKSLIFACLIAITCCQISAAQGLLQRKGIGGRLQSQSSNESDDSTSSRRNDVEGTIWEFKVIDPKEKDASKQTVMTGQIRIKQTSVFAVGKPKTTGGNAQAGQAAASDNVRGQLKGLLSQRINRAEQKSSGGDRIGDVSVGSSSRYKYQFDQDDSYPLSGLVDVTRNTKSKNGVWSGYYDEFAGGKKKTRWRFEMRRVED